MSDGTWHPLGVDTEEQVAAYDALHDGLPDWMASAFWAWVQAGITQQRRYPDGSGSVAMLDSVVNEHMCQALRIVMPTLRAQRVDANLGRAHLRSALEVLRAHPHPLQIADYLLAHGGHARPDYLDALLARSKSAWTVGVRSGRPGLVRRVPLGVQVAADAVMARAGRAGVRLAKAWEELYGLEPNPSEAYRLAILAVEDAAVPVVSPTNARATLGTVLRQIESQADWGLPMDREPSSAPSGQVVAGMLRLLWHGQHDRHGGQPSAPGNVSIEEATVAVSLAVALTQWFHVGLVRRIPA